MVLEVANTFLERDREKGAAYARAGVEDYWIVDGNDRRVIVHRGPVRDGYTTITEHREGSISPLLPAPPIVGEIFGRS